MRYSEVALGFVQNGLRHPIVLGADPIGPAQLRQKATYERRPDTPKPDLSGAHIHVPRSLLLAGGLVSLFASQGAAAHAASVNGRIVYGHYQDGTSTPRNIFSIAPSGKRERKLTERTGRNVNPSVSPNGRKVVFSSDRGGDADIFQMNANGSHQKRVLHSPGDQLWPVVSPSKSRDEVAFISDEGHPGRFSLHVASLDGSKDYDFPPSRLDLRDRPAWSRDGKTLAFTANTESHHGVGLYKTRRFSGGGLRTLLKGNSTIENPQAFLPSYAPNGKHIVFDGYGVDPFHEQVFEIRPNGSHLRALTSRRRGHLAGTSNGAPSYSPNGKKIAFTHNERLAIMRADGSKQRRVKGIRTLGDAPFWGRKCR